MSLSQALSAAMSGLRVTQTGLSIVAANVANAGTPGYVRKSPTQITTAAGDFGAPTAVEKTVSRMRLGSRAAASWAIASSGEANKIAATAPITIEIRRII